MKNFLTIIFLLSAAFAFAACGEEKTECQDMDKYLNDQICPDKTITFCATESGKGWFEFDDEKYECEGNGNNISCDKAFEEIYSACGRTNCEYESSSTCDYKVCSDENGGRWYEYNGKKYECEGTWGDLDCDRAIDELNNDCEGH
jgi:hypothetical protein